MKKKEYATTDFWLSAYLKANDFYLLRVWRDNGRTVFVFADRDDREEVVRDFYNDGIVKISAIRHAFKDMKSSIYNCER